MLHSEYYQGLPSEIWDDLTNDVEEILREEEIGTHVLGIYPSGSRLFGIESSSPQLICLYMDSPDDILNPAIRREMSNDLYFRSYTTRVDQSSIFFIEIHSWIQWITLRFPHSHPGRLKAMLDIIPCHEDIVYQDPSIDELIDMTREYLFDNGTVIMSSFKRSFNDYPLPPFYEEMITDALYYRTMYLLDKTKKFSPNINHHWNSNVAMLPEEAPLITRKLDEEMRQSVIHNDKMDEEKLRKYTHAMMSAIPMYKDPNQKLAIEMGKEVVKIYKFIL